MTDEIGHHGLPGDTAATAEVVLERLHNEAEGLGRPEQRLATLDRLVESCNAIVSGDAAEILRLAGQRDGRLRQAFELHFKRGIPELRPPRVEEYVKARRILELAEMAGSGGNRPLHWSGPMQATIRGEPAGMLLYVRLRAQEQAPAKRPRATSSAHASVHADIDLIRDMSAQQRLRKEIEAGWQAKRELDRLKKWLLQHGIRSLESSGSIPEPKALPAPPQPLAGPMSGADVDAIVAFVATLQDEPHLAGFRLVNDGSRVKHMQTHIPLIGNSALKALLRHFGGHAESTAPRLASES